jgi:hypothetical protein
MKQTSKDRPRPKKRSRLEISDAMLMEKIRQLPFEAQQEIERNLDHYAQRAKMFVVDT